MTQELRNTAQTLLDAQGAHPKYAADLAYRKEAHPAAILALLDRLEKAEKDAARYQWLRDQIYVDEDKRLRITRTYLIADQGKTFQERLDDAVDSAMEASK